MNTTNAIRSMVLVLSILSGAAAADDVRVEAASNWAMVEGQQVGSYAEYVLFENGEPRGHQTIRLVGIDHLACELEQTVNGDAERVRFLGEAVSDDRAAVRVTQGHRIRIDEVEYVCTIVERDYTPIGGDVVSTYYSTSAPTVGTWGHPEYGAIVVLERRGEVPFVLALVGHGRE